MYFIEGAAVTTREMLVKSAQELLWERGYVAMSPGAVQQRSGVGQGSMYHHFSGKADLAAVAIEQSAAEFRTAAERYLDTPGTALERLRGYMLRSRHVMKGCRIGRLTQDPEISQDDRLRVPLETTFAWLRRRLRSLIEEAQRDGDLSSELDAADVATLLVAAVQGGYVLAGASGSPRVFHSAIRGAVSLLR